MKQLHLELTRIVRGGRSGLDYIKVPDNEWHFDHQINELFCFKEGLFYAHVCIVRADKRFTTKVIIKKLPDSAVIATVDSNADLHQLKQSHGIQTWTKITDNEALESSLLRHNKNNSSRSATARAPTFLLRWKPYWESTAQKAQRPTYSPAILPKSQKMIANMSLLGGHTLP